MSLEYSLTYAVFVSVEMVETWEQVNSIEVMKNGRKNKENGRSRINSSARDK